MNKLTSQQRKFLKGKAHSLEPVVMVGKNGVSDSLIKLTDEVLKSHELIKVRFIDFKDKKKMLLEEIVERTGSEAVGMIGHVAILYRQNPDEEKRKIDLPAKK
ncbi:ribosome assembly RNA-binding protein YhbY [Thermodesulfobacteriota bacterium]